MKLTLAVGVAFAAVASAQKQAPLKSGAEALVLDLDDASVDLKTRFQSFAHTFSKQYDSDEARDVAFAAFAQNEAKIQDHNAKGLSYTLGHNEFSDLTSEAFNAMYIGNVFDNPNLDREANVDYTLQEPEVQAMAPDAIDWVTEGAVTPVKNQGQCGSCWAFSTVMGIEGDYKITTGELKSFSEQDLVSCDHNGDQGCNGGLMDNAFQWVEQNGICTEADYPYSSGTGTTGTCKTTCTPAATITGYKDVPANDEAALKAAVAKQPVSVAIEADKSVFQLYKSGVLTSDSCGTTLDHGVGIVGYGALDGTDYWKVKNSWGATWGLDGYILLERGTNECGISQSASYPTGAKAL